MKTQELLRHAKAACPQLAWLGSEEKNQAILRMANAIEANADMILAANAEDLRCTQKICVQRRASFPMSCSTVCV